LLAGQPGGRLPEPPQCQVPLAYQQADTHDRVRADIIGATGTVTLRTGGKLYHIGIGRAYAGTHIIMLVQDLDIRVIDAATGELLRDLTLDPSRNYQPTGRPARPTPRTKRQPKHPEP
jgi:hypothetical protein